jgi:hypothetical protein
MGKDTLRRRIAPRPVRRFVIRKKPSLPKDRPVLSPPCLILSSLRLSSQPPTRATPPRGGGPCRRPRIGEDFHRGTNRRESIAGGPRIEERPSLPGHASRGGSRRRSAHRREAVAAGPRERVTVEAASLGVAVEAASVEATPLGVAVNALPPPPSSRRSLERERG